MPIGVEKRVLSLVGEVIGLHELEEGGLACRVGGDASDPSGVIGATLEWLRRRGPRRASPLLKARSCRSLGREPVASARPATTSYAWYSREMKASLRRL